MTTCVLVDGSLSAPRGVERQLGAVPEARLAQDPGDVVLGRTPAYIAGAGDLGVVAPWPTSLDTSISLSERISVSPSVVSSPETGDLASSATRTPETLPG